MDSKQAIGKTLEADALDAAWRSAGTQFVKLAREPLVALLQSHVAPDDELMRARIAAFLETELGDALLASMLSLGLAALPTGVGGELPGRMSRELRVRAMSAAGNTIAEVLMGPLRQVAVTYLQGLPGEGVNAPAEAGALPSPSEAVVAPAPRAGVLVGDGRT